MRVNNRQNIYAQKISQFLGNDWPSSDFCKNHMKIVDAKDIKLEMPKFGIISQDWPNPGRVCYDKFRRPYVISTVGTRKNQEVIVNRAVVVNRKINFFGLISEDSKKRIADKITKMYQAFDEKKESPELECPISLEQIKRLDIQSAKGNHMPMIFTSDGKYFVSGSSLFKWIKNSRSKPTWPHSRQDITCDNACVLSRKPDGSIDVIQLSKLDDNILNGLECLKEFKNIITSNISNKPKKNEFSNVLNPSNQNIVAASTPIRNTGSPFSRWLNEFFR